MRAVKLFLFVSAALFVVITLFSLLIPSTVRVSRLVVINTTQPQLIRSQTDSVTNWKNWQPYLKNGRVKIVSLSATACEIQYGEGSTVMQIKSVDSNAVHFTIKASGENIFDNAITIRPLPIANAYQAEWVATTTMKWYPWQKFYAIFIDKITGPGYEAALNGLKEYVEAHD